MPDRLPSLIVLVGFWVPPAVAGWVAAAVLERSARRVRASVIYPALAALVLGYAAAWFYFNVGRMPPYIPGSLPDPTIATPRAVMGLAVFTGALVLPGSALACILAFRRRSSGITRPGERA
jgi:cytochrome bd-type quinol oxidase subunit 1